MSPFLSGGYFCPNILLGSTLVEWISSCYSSLDCFSGIITIKFIWWLIIPESVEFKHWIIISFDFSKYSDVKLGNDDDVPEYNNFSWFMMLFSCGIGVGLFFYGVAEPIFHYTNRNRYSADPTLPDNELAQISINLPMLHWGKYSQSFPYLHDINFCGCRSLDNVSDSTNHWCCF